jgi:hypothetical protein
MRDRSQAREGPDEAEFQPADRDADVVIDDVDTERVVLVVTPAS